VKLHEVLLLLWPPTIRRRLEQLQQAALVPVVPTLWQVELGVLRMWYRTLFRSGTIGCCRDHPVRQTWRAQFLQFRPLRFPFLMWERAIAPWDMSGLLSGRERIIRHLLGAHHDQSQFIYDLQMLQLHPGALDELQERLEAILDGTDPRAEWLRDLCVYKHYHEALHGGLMRFRGDQLRLGPGEADDPDITFLAYLHWCATQPPTPRDSWRRLWSRG